MRLIRLKLAALGTAVALAACGGGGAGDQHPQVAFTGMVSFGDSLSDVGTYKVGTIAALGGGKWTVNSPTAKNWTELIAADIMVAPPCAAETGLLSNIPGIALVPVTDVPTCFNYAQGSSRVSNVFAPSSATLQQFGQVNLGLMAVPITTQLATHLARKGSYSGTELVTVLGGGNDFFMNFNGVAAAAAGGASAVGGAITAGWSQSVQAAVASGGAAAVGAASQAAVAGMGQAGAELAGLVKTQIVAKGAKYVIVVNLPDVSQTPFALALDAQTRSLMQTMVTTFNAQLAAGLNGAPVVLVDAYTQGHDQNANPAQYSLTNVTTAACSATSAANPLQGSSIACTSASLIAGDTSHYEFADSVHPTPYGYQLLAQFVAIQMAKAGWL
jgi:outer membrane lipase/esterase